MACRLINLSQHPLRIDMRGGEMMVIAPGHTSRALREELLYDNPNIGDWERMGMVARVPARLSEVSGMSVEKVGASATSLDTKKAALGAPATRPAEDKTEHEKTPHEKKTHEKSRGKSQHSKK